MKSLRESFEDADQWTKDQVEEVCSCDENMLKIRASLYLGRLVEVGLLSSDLYTDIAPSLELNRPWANPSAN